MGSGPPFWNAISTFQSPQVCQCCRLNATVKLCPAMTMTLV
jgi:hypothetical protein